MKIVFMGTPAAAAPSLARLLKDGHEVVAVYSQPDKPSGRGNKVSFSPVKEFALERDLPVLQPAKIRTPEALDEFRSHSAEVAVVVAYGRILPGTYLTAFPQGVINVHFSLLPKYRGAAPVNWAIANGETETGVTTMLMDEGLDTGDVYLQKRTLIGEEENSIQLMDRLALIGADLLSETLGDLSTIASVKQESDESSLAPIMKKEDGAIDWQMASKEIANRVRGFQPFPTAYSRYQDRKLTLFRARAIESESSESLPGRVIEAKGDNLIVACGSGTALQVEELQLEGKRRMPTRDFLNGVKLLAGERLG
ncbi:MAG: methionyl-tRNA formyltransferase [Acidobacteriota bacterium]